MRRPWSTLVRVLLWAVASAAFVALLFLVVFPWFDATFVTDPVLDTRARPLFAARG